MLFHSIQGAGGHSVAAPPSGITVVGYVTTTNATTLSLTGIGLQANDVVILFGAEDDSTVTVPSGYTGASVSGGLRAMYAYKVMGSTPDTSITGLNPGGTKSGYIAIGLRGVDTANVYNGTPANANSGASDGNPNPPSVTTSSAGMILIFGGLDDDQTTMTGSSGYTDIASYSFGSSGNGGSFVVSYLITTAAGTYDPGTCSPGTDAAVAITLPIKQA